MRNKAVLSLILLVTGFILAYSYQYVKIHHPANRTTSEQYQQENQLRKQIIDEQVSNQKQQAKLEQIRVKIHSSEETLAKQKSTASHLLDQLNTYRMLNGQTKITGPGVKMTLKDANYVPNGDNPNNYIVHQQDLQEVIYELNAMGAEALAVNGQRFSVHSYIECVGPVVKVDGERHSAPFVISAIGDPEVLMSALNMTGGVVELLTDRGIDVSVEKVNTLTIDPLF